VDDHGQRRAPELSAPTRPRQLLGPTTGETAVGALGARRPGRVRARIVWRLAWTRRGGGAAGVSVANRDDERGRRPSRGRRRDDAAHATANAAAVVVVMSRLGAVRRAVMMRRRSRRRHRDTAVGGTGVHHPRFAHDEWEPDREHGRYRTEPALLTHRHQNAPRAQTVPALSGGRRE
jgi:hypothetical protein